MSAPVFPLPPEMASFITIEFPGPVNPSHSSVEKALASVGGVKRVGEAVNAQDPSKATVELNYSQRALQDGNYVHPIHGEPVETGNIVLVVTRRRRKRPKPGEGTGVFSYQVSGLIKRTVRFRAMADFHYQPRVDNDPAVNLARALKTFDVDTILDFRFAPPNENFEGDLNLLPPPIFSRISHPTLYNYKAPISSVPTTFVNASGEEVTRMINRDRYKSAMPASISHYQDRIPDSSAAPSTKGANSADEKRILAKMQRLLEQRPIWSRLALTNEMGAEDSKKLTNAMKHLYSLCAYTFSDGPYRELLVRFGFDPRKDVGARKFQRLMLRRTDIKKVQPEMGMSKEDEEDRLRSHIFDGRKVSRGAGNYQLCDVTDRLLAPLLDDPQWYAESCNERSGWYLPSFYEGFRELLRLKFMAITTGSVLADSEMVEYIGRLPSGDTLEQDRRFLRAEAIKRESQRSQSVQQQEEEEEEVQGSGGEQVERLKRKAIKPKPGAKPRAKVKATKPTIIDRLAPHLEMEGEDGNQ